MLFGLFKSETITKYHLEGIIHRHIYISMPRDRTLSNQLVALEQELLRMEYILDNDVCKQEGLMPEYLY